MSILVYLENWDGKFKKSSFELVSYAKAMAEKTGGDVTVLSIGDVSETELQELSKYGASKILSAKGDIYKSLDNAVYSKTISAAAQTQDCKIIVMANNNTGKGIAPRVAVRLKAGLVSGATALPLSIEPFQVQKNVFSGKAQGVQQVNTRNKVITLAQNSFMLMENELPFAHEVFDAGIGAEELKTELMSVDKVTDKLLLSDADIVVSAGRGMKAPENWGPVEELAQVLGAATACSRPVSDEGWRGHEEHVGQTGKVIAPNLYFAFGISGAIQHLAGVSSSKVIVAINTDAEAPIFGAADYGIIGDLKEVLPKLVEAAKSFKASV
ncbi:MULTISPECIES: electron transfer flavoprotein subunit alpha/FixB family protein [unclassified Lentimicrobium]|uniref:electron transfer flavoprotein subunit alpha/FixB family protein n=1 Tax=unclassified Lentimicrobium TaxID=2677434 RepID=UPI001556A238|nr:MULTISPECIES: electron transfer flavoprotein subunit alpha/FixB family protein [unclassified Lentimicrobium]NPD44125.1 electron transfer flavoprotein subunit alpha/FixB family protein [Lentimicrobium sp. S6]NPD86712.1 electron transfer flavoprotein subunit alpha/FixB family protein [Lentimicrobium sp. L6]